MEDNEDVEAKQKECDDVKYNGDEETSSELPKQQELDQQEKESIQLWKQQQLVQLEKQRSQLLKQQQLVQQQKESIQVTCPSNMRDKPSCTLDDSVYKKHTSK